MKMKNYLFLLSALAVAPAVFGQMPERGKVSSITPMGSYVKACAAADETAVYVESFESGCQWKVSDARNKMSLGRINSVRAFDGQYYLVSSYDSMSARDAYALSPGVALEAGKTYYISMQVYVPGYDGVNEEFELLWGSAEGVENMTNVLLDYKGENAFACEDWEKVETTFVPEADGEYFFSIHHCTSATYVNAAGFDRFYIGLELDTYEQVIPVVLPEPDGEKLEYLTTYDDIYYGYTEKGAKVVYGENDTVFIQGMAPQLPNAWVYGIDTGDAIEVPGGQYIGVYKDFYSGDYDMWLLFGQDYVASSDPENDPLNFSYTLTEKLRLLKDGDSFSAEDGAVLMQSSSQTGVQLFNGCVDYKLTPFSEAKVTLPADAEMKLYTLSFSSNKYYEDRSVLTNVAFAGDTIFVCKASYYMNYMDDAWFYGIMEGDKITFPSGQYMGYYEGGYGLFPVYFYGGEVTGQDESGYDIVAAGDELVLTLDEDGSFFSSDYYVMMLGGTIEEECWNLRLEEFNVSPAIPVAPWDITLSTLPDDNLRVYFEEKDVDGNVLVADSVYFRIYLDDELLTFVPASQGGDYENLTEPMTDIPLNFSDGHDFYFTQYGTKSMTVYLYEDFQKASVETVYKMNGYVGVSARAVYDINDGYIGTEGEGSLTKVSVESVMSEDAETVGTFTYNLQGVMVPDDTKGLVIKVDLMSDGSRRTYKTINE